MKRLYPRIFPLVGAALLMAACATPQRQTIDYSAFKESRPRSIVVLPPLNASPDVHATYGMLSQVTYPLAEAGYYVLPVTLVDETFRQNGFTAPGEIHAVAPSKLRDIFGADAALYITVTRYGAEYHIVDSATAVSANAKLVDLKSGDTLWTGSASASNREGGNNGGGSIVGMLISAAVHQVIDNIRDAGFEVAGITSQRLLSAGRPGGLLYGPRSPQYRTD